MVLQLRLVAEDSGSTAASPAFFFSEAEMHEKTEQKSTRMHCTAPELNDVLLFFSNGDVTARQHREIEAHLVQCKACQEDLRFFDILKEIQREEVMVATQMFLKDHVRHNK
jgi:hypothetical protein